MSFRITGLSPAFFAHLFGLPDQMLARHGVKRCIADRKPGFPDRIEVRDAEPGERLLLLNYTHQPAATPYRASHAIFVREHAVERYDRIDEIPEVLRLRLISLRAFDDGDEMIDGAVLDGARLEAGIEAMFADPAARYLHAHYASRGCYAARVDRA
jgi:hypothetical protein